MMQKLLPYLCSQDGAYDPMIVEALACYYRQAQHSRPSLKHTTTPRSSFRVEERRNTAPMPMAQSSSMLEA